MAVSRTAPDSLVRLAAYQGDGWLPRRADMERFSDASETSRLRRVVLFRPDPTWPPPVDGWNSIQYLRPVDFLELQHELDALGDVLGSDGVEVDFLDETVSKPAGPIAYNRIFMRDTFWPTPWGVVLARLASRPRAMEEQRVRAYIDLLHAPVLGSIAVGTFEAADALWLHPGLVLLGVGNRTSPDASSLLRGILRALEVDVVEVPLPRAVQHLLGLIQFVSDRKVIVRAELAPTELRRVLESHAYTVCELRESDEVVRRQAMNVVVVRDNLLIMPANCPRTRTTYERWGIETVPSPCTQISAAAGGLACVTGVVRRGEVL